MGRASTRWLGGWLLLLAAGWSLLASPPAAAQGFGKNKIQYRKFDWKIYHSPHFDVYYYAEEENLLEKVVSFAESAYDHLSREFDYQIKQPTPLIFYATHSAFEQNNIILNFIPEGTGAFASPVRNRMVLPVDLPDPELLALILHELTHIFQYHILFGGKLGRGVASTPPIWFMEGMASYMAKDETARDKMFLRDAVVNDRLPSVADNFQGFFAYRFGHAVFDFIEERWGKEGFRDFMVEMRNTLGARVEPAVKRTFQMEREDFDSEFRRWLRKKYLPQLLETGEPSDFGRPFLLEQLGPTQELSPTASPSGDLVAAFTTMRGEVDVALFDTRQRSFLRNLTKGFSNKFQYFVAQELQLGREMGRDLSFSPDGNTVAVFAKREKGRVLVLVDVLKGKIRRIVEVGVEQPLSPAWSPDGRTLAFSGNREGRFDLFLLDLETNDVSQLTDDEIYDGSPAWSPDGKSLVFSSVIAGYAKLFRVGLGDPAQRFQLTQGESNEVDAVYSPGGKRVYFTSDRSGANNIFSLDLESGEIRQHTNSLTGCFMPTVLAPAEGAERLVYTAYWKGRFDLYRLDIEEPITQPTVVEEGAGLALEPLAAEELPRFEPAIEVTIDEANKEGYRGKKFFLEDISGGLGVSDDQTFIGALVFSFSDYLGDHRIIGAFQSVESFQNFDVYYLNLSRRVQWQLHLFDDQDFFIGLDQSTGFAERVTSLFQETGATASLIFPIDFYNRVEVGGGYIYRDIDFQSFVLDPDTGEAIPVITPRQDDFPVAQAGFVSDTAIFGQYGAVSGRRFRLDGSYAPDLDESGTLTETIAIDYRQYVPLTRRINFALRAVGSFSEGNFPSPVYFGGLDTVRGFDFRSIVGDHGFFANLELRFPLVDYLATPVFDIQGIRAAFFLDVGGAWFADIEGFDFYNEEEDRLEDGVSSYGVVLTARLFGLDLNWALAKRWDFDQTLSDFETSFWIGPRF